MESATENNRPTTPRLRRVRVKMCGKSAQLCIAICMRGKPYQEQDKEVCVGRSFRFKHTGMSHR